MISARFARVLARRVMFTRRILGHSNTRTPVYTICLSVAYNRLSLLRNSIWARFPLNFSRADISISMRFVVLIICFGCWLCCRHNMHNVICLCWPVFFCFYFFVNARRLFVVSCRICVLFVFRSPLSASRNETHAQTHSKVFTRSVLSQIAYSN